MKQAYKSIDFTPWGGLEGFLQATSNGAGVSTRASLLKRIVPWLTKAVSMTSNAVAGLPFEIVNDAGEVVDTSTDWGNVIGGIDSPRRTLQLIASSLCGGSAYLIPERTSRMLVNLQYVAPQTIAPFIDYRGLQYFQRSSPQGVVERLDPDELIYFWLPDSDVEIGAPLSSPMSAALMAAELLASMSTTMKIYGDRGFVPAYLGNAKGMPTEIEKKKTEAYLTQFLRGAYNSVVKLINADALTLLKVGAGMEEMKGAYTEIQQQAIEDVGTAFGIPAAIFMSDKAFASEVNPLIRQWYETSTFVTLYHTIEETFNQQLLKQWNYRMQFKPESLSAFQEDENSRASAVGSYTSAIKDDPTIAKFVMSFMGVDLDEEQEQELDEIIAGKELDKETIAAQMQQQPAPVQEQPQAQPTSIQKVEPMSPDETKDLALWYSKAKAWHLKGKGNAVDWENKHLREEIAAPIRLRLASARNELDIVKAFEVKDYFNKWASLDLSHGADSIKELADSINKAVEVEIQMNAVTVTHL